MKKLETSQFTTRTFNALQKNEIITVSDLKNAYDADKCKSVKGIGAKSLEEIEEFLAKTSSATPEEEKEVMTEAKKVATHMTTVSANKTHIGMLEEVVVRDRVVVLHSKSRTYKVLKKYARSKGMNLDAYVELLGYQREVRNRK